LLTIARDGGDIPKWPLANVYSGCMTGQHAFIMIVDALHKNLTLPEADLTFLYQTMVKEATQGVPHSGRDGLEDYLSKGYVPNDKSGNGASLTLEYAFDDWAVSVMALYMQDEASAAVFRNRSRNYANVFDKTKLFMCPRDSAGVLHCRHPTQQFYLNHDYTEGNAWQWTFFVPHDPLGLVALFGTKEAFSDKLNECFSRSRVDPFNVLPNPYYWAGNEPDLLHAWMFVFAGRPDLTQQWTRWLVQHKYTTGPDGIPGNDDYGTMSAWVMMASFGFYPLSGFPLYIIGSPSFPSGTLNLPGGVVVSMVANNWSEKALYVASVSLNGTPLAGPVLQHSQLIAGCTLVFEMSETATKWGSDFDWRYYWDSSKAA